jgi:hypothetical protein
MIGVIGRKGRQHGISTPVADFAYAILLPVELKARGQPRGSDECPGRKHEC